MKIFFFSQCNSAISRTVIEKKGKCKLKNKKIIFSFFHLHIPFFQFCPRNNKNAITKNNINFLNWNKNKFIDFQYICYDQ